VSNYFKNVRRVSFAAIFRRHISRVNKYGCVRAAILTIYGQSKTSSGQLKQLLL